MLLAVLGGAAGTLFAVWGRTALVGLAVGDSRFMLDIDRGLDVRVLAFTLAISLVDRHPLRTGAGVADDDSRPGDDAQAGPPHDDGGLAPQKHAGRPPGGALGRDAGGAGLFLRTLYNLERVRLGFNQEKLLVFTLQPRQAGYEGRGCSSTFYDRLFARLDALPGVRAATFGHMPLIADYTWNTSVLLPGETPATAADHY